MKATILIIDDNVALTTLLGKTLSRFGFDPVIENNPLLAINTARHCLPDLILLDVMMPERDGGRVLADLRADISLRYIPVVLLTGIAREAKALSMTGGLESVILSKPVQLKELMNTINSELASCRTFNEQKAFEEEHPEVIPENGSDIEVPNFDRLEASPERPLLQEFPPLDNSFSPDSTPPVDFSFPEPEERDEEKRNTFG